MMYILHRQLNGKFLPLADFWCEPHHSQLKIEGRVTHFSGRKWFTGLTSLVYQGVSTMTCYHIIWIGRHGWSIMYIVFPIRFDRLQWCNGYLASLPRWRPRFVSPTTFFFLYKFSNPNRIITVMVTDMRLSHFFFKFAFCQNCVAIFWS